MKLSIIIPLYNTEKYIEKCIRSIYIGNELPLSEYEVLVVNDGSTDNGPNIVENLCKEYPNITLFNKENGGVSSARNKGIEESKGEYLFFVDSDDTIDSKLFSVFSKLEEEIDIIKFGYNHIQDGKTTTKIPYKSFKYDNIEEYNRDNFEDIYSIWIHLFHRKTLNRFNIKFSDGIKYGEDLEFTTKCYLVANKILTINRAFYNYCFVNPDSAMAKNVTINSVFDHYRIIENLITFIDVNKDSIAHPTLSQNTLIVFFKFYLCRIALKKDYYLNLFTFQKQYNKMYSLLKSKGYYKTTSLFFITNRISILPYLLYIRLRKKQNNR